jgi:outer membrane murein-binding lipoprotein Lpp
MATTNTKTLCYSCHKDIRTFLCQGCEQNFCLDDLTNHLQELKKDLEKIENDHDQFRQLINAQKQNSNDDSFVKQIDQWENESIDKIKQTAKECRDEINKYLIKIENKFDDLAKELEEIRQNNQFDKIHLDQMKTKLNEEFEKVKNISIQQKSSIFIHQIFVRIKEGEKNSIRYSFG